MTDTTARHAESAAHRVFEGLAPEFAEPVERERSHRAMRSTVPIILVGSMAAMTLNLTGSVEPVAAKPPLKPRGATAQLGASIKDAVAAAANAVRSSTAAIVSSTTAAPPTYTVAAGDTVSDIATRFGLSTASVLALNGLSWSSLIFPGQKLTLTNGSALPAVPQPESPAPSAGRYTIVSGDTISAIADRFGVSTLSLLTANGLGWSSIIYPGQTLAIPGVLDVDEAAAVIPEAAVPEVAPAPDQEPAPEPAPPSEPPAAEPVYGRYTVVAGDTLSGIAARHGIDTQSLLDANGLAWDSLIFTGDVLLIPGGATPTVPASSGGSVTVLDEEMRANAAVIIQVGRELGVPDYGIVIALATAMQESSMRNLNWGDRDSVGLFQQRPSSGWGTVEQLTTPAYAARLFYGGPSNPNAGSTRGLLDISGWESMPLTVAAQAVQISAFPDAYAKWEESARAWFAELG